MPVAANCATSRRSGEERTVQKPEAAQAPSFVERRQTLPSPFSALHLGAPPSPRDHGASHSSCGRTFPVARWSPGKTGHGHKGRLNQRTEAEKRPRRDAGRGKWRSEAKRTRGIPGTFNCKEDHRSQNRIRTSRVGQFKLREAPQRLRWQISSLDSSHSHSVGEEIVNTWLHV